MIRRRVERRKSERKWLYMRRSVRGTDEWRSKQGRRRAGIAQTIRRLGFIDGDRIALDHRIENPEPSPDAHLSGAADDLAQKPIRFAGRISQTQPWSKTVLLRNQRIRNSRIRRINQTLRRGRVNLRLLAQIERGNLVVLL